MKNKPVKRSKKNNYSKFTSEELFSLLSLQDKWIINEAIASCGIEGYHMDEKGMKKLILSILGESFKKRNL